MRLRRKLSAVAPKDTIIATERGGGYRLAVPVKRRSLHPADIESGEVNSENRTAHSKH